MVEGIPTRRTTVVEQGMLRSYLLDTYTARKLGQRSTGNAARSAGEPPSVSPTNFYLAPGAYTPEEMIASGLSLCPYPYSDTFRTCVPNTRIYGYIKDRSPLALATAKSRFHTYKLGQRVKVTL